MTQIEVTTDIVNAEQGKLIDATKLYIGALNIGERHRRMYLFLIGTCLRQLKTTCQHGQFGDLKTKYFPDAEQSLLGRAMNFSEAVEFFADRQISYVGNPVDGKLLGPCDLPEKLKEKLIAEIEEATEGDGIMETINQWRKKTAKPDPVDAVKAEQEHQRNIQSAFETAEANLLRLLDFKDADFFLATPDARKAIAALCVRYGKRIKKRNQLKRPSGSDLKQIASPARTKSSSSNGSLSK